MGKCHTYRFIQWLISSKASHISFLTVQLNIQQCHSTPRWSKGLIWLTSWWESWLTSAHPVALMVHTEAMFHQVHVQEQDRDVLCSLWWPWGDIDQPPTCYHMTVHLIGGIWSMNYCTYVLHQTLSDNSHLYSKPAQRHGQGELLCGRLPEVCHLHWRSHQPVPRTQEHASTRWF